MGSGLSAGDPTIVAAFKAALLHQGLVVLALLALLVVAWRVLRIAELRRADGPAGEERAAPSIAGRAKDEPAGRRLARVGFGLLWILDGVLQGQAAMPTGLAGQVLRPVAASSPGWVQHLVGFGATIWSYHPVQAAASAVWIQVGLGIFLLVAPRGAFSRLAGVASATWGLVVWVFGEAFGGIFAPGLSVLFGAPGAALLYVAAGVAVALPDRSWQGHRRGRRLLGVMGLAALALAVLQAWPGRGFWAGSLGHGGGRPGTIAAMVTQMASVSQPHFLSSWLSAFAGFDRAHAFAVNLVVVAVLSAIGIAFVSGRPRLVRPALAVAAVFCVADWVLVQDLGFLGGLGTDPNSMPPILLVLAAGYLALARAPEPAAAPAPAQALPGAAVPRGRRLGSLGEALARRPAYLLRSLAALGALGVVLLGAVPMAVASASSNADPIVAQAIDGTPAATRFAAADFRLVDQAGRAVSLTSLRGKTLVLTFLDPVCTSDCPLIAQELRRTDALLGPQARRVELVAVDANPLYEARPYLVSFDQQEHLDRLPNWLFLTGTSLQLARVWRAYGIQVERATGGAMIAHSDVAYVIDDRGTVRWALVTTPGAGTAAVESSFAGTLAGALRRTLASS